MAEIKMHSFSITLDCLQAYLPIWLSSKTVNVIGVFEVPSLASELPPAEMKLTSQTVLSEPLQAW